jgi:hypothetical protein
MSTIQNSGVAMMLKAMGIDPAALIAKGAELEAMGKVLAAELLAKVTVMEARLTAIEATLESRVSTLEQLLQQINVAVAANINVISRIESSQAGTVPAGDTYDAEVVNPQTKEI